MSRPSDLPANLASVYPLSPMQEGMLFHTLLRPSSGIYLMQNRYRLSGQLDARAFVRAFEQVVQRHPMLRTSFVWKSQKRPLQVVHKSVDLPFEVHDLRGLTSSEQEARIAGELQAELAVGFDFGKAPLMRFRLLRLGERSYEFVHSFHHILLDEWCTSLIMSDFVAHYDALVHDRPLSLRPARPYRDYVDWLARQDAAEMGRFWRGHLRDFKAPTSLGFEEPAHAVPGEVEDLSERLDARSTSALLAMAQSQRLTLNTIAQGAWALVLSRYSGEPEVAFGVTVAGRPPELPEVESIVGLFINTLPLRVTVAAEQRLVPWLRGLFEQNLSVRRYEHTPLVDVQRWSEIERGQPLFHSLFVFENAPIDPQLRKGSLFRVEQVRDRVHTNYPVTAMAWPDDELGLKISYDTGRVPRSVALRMLAHFRTVLEGMAARPEARLAELGLLTGAERTRALDEWNPAAQLAQPAFESYRERFRRQLAATPDATAVTAGERRLSYAELGRKAEHVARALAALGVGRDDRVAVVDARGIELLVMILAVFEAGAAYVPIDPAYPDPRIASMLASSSPRVVLTRRAGEARLSALTLAQTPVLALEALLAAPCLRQQPAVHGGPTDLAYVIHTSGSTGTPKGAMVECQGMLNNMLTKLPRLSLAAGDVIAQTASPCFDISVWQFLTALLFGGTVDIVPDEVTREPARLLRYVEARGITVLEIVPQVLQGMAEAAEESADAPQLSRLRWILPTGEALPVATARRWLERYPAVPLLNAYGPAECSDDVAMHALTIPPTQDEAQVPIGRPVDHFRLYVLDRWLEPCPVGIRGELYVAGIGVGRGYLAEPARTAACFVPDPFSREPGRRMYRTGDQARYRADGSLEFVGRRDQQVKIRGFRIELGDIEARLAEHPGVRDAAVSVREERPGARRLVAYVAGQEPLAPQQLRSWLSARLPDYMVPATYVQLSTLPRNANGKIDRQALPEPGVDSERPYRAPRSESEQLLAQIWREVLGVERVSLDDSFFELGGHSLLLTQVLSRVRKLFEVEVPLRTLFEQPTLAGHAQAVAEAVSKQDAAASGFELLPRKDPLPLSFAQERLWFLAQLEPSAASYNVPAAVRVRGPLDLACLERAFTQLIERHETLRTRFCERQGRAAAVVESQARFSLAVEDLSQRSLPGRDEQLRERIDAEAARPFELTQAPLLRALLLRLAADEHVLLVVLHHMISDGWSMGVLVQELSELYAAERERRAPLLAPLSAQYADYASFQRKRLEGPLIEQQLAHFRSRLGGELPLLELPTDFERPQVRSYRGARLSFELPTVLSKELRALAQKRGVTPYMLLLAAFQTLLARRTAQTDLCVGTPVANRGYVEIETLIGLFVNTLVLRNDLAGDPPFDVLLTRVRGEVLAAQAHQELPFERLVQALKPTRHLGQTPLFQVMFSLQEAGARMAPASGLTFEPMEVDPGSAQFDLSLHMLSEGEALSGMFGYSTDLFVEGTVREFCADFCTLVEGILAQPFARLSELALPTRPARERLPARTRSALPREVAFEPSRADVEARLSAIWADVLGRERVERDDNFFALGGDSILSLQVVARARQAGMRITARHMFEFQTLAELAAQAALSGPNAAAAEQAAVEGEAPLLPIQQRFFARALPNPQHWNQALLLSHDEPLSFAALQQAVSALLAQHDALRLCYVQHEGRWTQHHVSIERGAVLHRTDLSRVAASERAKVVEAHAARWQASFELGSGPLFRVVSFEFGPGQGGRLLLLAHHLVVDAVSFRILLDDLASAYEQALREQSVQLPEKTSPYKRWGERLTQAVAEGRLQRDVEPWLQLPWEQVRPLPVDRPGADRSEARLATESCALSEPHTRALLNEVAEAYRARVEEVLLAALAMALERWAGLTTVAVEVEGHGRQAWEDEDLDVSRTVGWFTSVFPVVMQIEPGIAPGPLLVSVKEQLRRLPRGGLSFGAVRELGACQTAQRLRALPAVELAFNYLGQWDTALSAGSRFALCADASGPEHDPAGALAYEIEIDAAVYGGRLEATFRYSAARYEAQTIRRLGSAFQRALETLIAECPEREALAYSPSDFSDVKLDQGELSALLEQME